MRSRYGDLVLAWFLVVQTDRLILDHPYVEPPRIVARFDMSEDNPDGGLEACIEARDALIAQGIKAECQELI